jgi:glycosyltransferase involved in cell wall biosynthesis
MTSFAFSSATTGRSLRALRGSRVLFVNWRDPEHPQAGGAEVYCWELARRFAAAGAHVTLLTSRPPGTARVAAADGVRIVRRGGRLSLYPAAALFLLRHRRFDAIVDCQNGIPFFVPLFARRRTGVVCVIHHVHQDQFRVHFPWPLSAIGRWLEGPASRRVYGRRAVVAVSPSTRTAVRRRLGLQGPIFVVPNGTAPPQPTPEHAGRAATPTIVCVGRLVAHKRMDLLLRAVAALLPTWPTLCVHLAGDGPDRARLEALAREWGVAEAVRFHGYVTEQAKTALLRSAWLTVNPSMAEGWGLGIIEANAFGVPAVACRVPGLRDSVRDGVTGWLVDGPDDLVAGVDTGLRVLSSPDAAARWAARCVSWAARFSWDDSAERLAGVVAAERASRARPDRRHRRGPRDSDLACVAEFTVDDAERFAVHAAGRLRPVDLWSASGSRVRLLLHGADEVDTRRVLARLGVADSGRVRVATSYDLLVGPGWGEDLDSWLHRPRPVVGGPARKAS